MTRQTAAARWFHLKLSPWKKTIVKMAKMIRVMTSWMTFNWTSVNGPPFPWKPSRLPGIWSEYSKNAIAHDNRITPISGQLLIIFISWSFRWPYHAKVIKILEQISNRIVYSPFMLKLVFNRIFMPQNYCFSVLVIRFWHLFFRFTFLSLFKEEKLFCFYRTFSLRLWYNV